MTSDQFKSEVFKHQSPAVVVRDIKGYAKKCVYYTFGCTYDGLSAILMLTKSELKRFSTPLDQVDADDVRELNVIDHPNDGTYHFDTLIDGVYYHIRLTRSVFKNRISVRYLKVLDEMSPSNTTAQVALLVNIQRTSISKPFVVGYEPLAEGILRKNYFKQTDSACLLEFDPTKPVLKTCHMIQSIKEMLARCALYRFHGEAKSLRKECSFGHERMVDILKLLPLKGA